MKIRCFTNLDLLSNEVWPNGKDFGNIRPMVGDYVQSKTRHPQYKRDETGRLLGGSPINYKSLELIVVSITFASSSNEPQMVVELNVPANRFATLTDFYTYYSRITNTSVSSFI